MSQTTPDDPFMGGGSSAERGLLEEAREVQSHPLEWQVGGRS